MTGGCSPEAAVAAVCARTGGQPGANLPWIVAYAAAVYRATTGAVPAPHGAAIAAAEDEIGSDNVDVVAGWVSDNRDWIHAAGSVLDATRDVAASPVREVPAAALAAGEVAELLAAAAGDPLVEIIWAGVCATEQWRARYLGVDVTVRDVTAADPIAAAAYRWLDDEDGGRIAAEVRRSLSQIDELAGEIAGA
jgi:hypothetical protein